MIYNIHAFYMYVCVCVCVCVYTHSDNGLVAKSCPTRDLMNCSLSGSSVHRIFQVRILEWLAITSSRISS